MSDTQLQAWLQNNNFGTIVARQALSGGDISTVERITTDSGGDFCIKQHAGAAEDFFSIEAQGLAAIRKTNTFRVPNVIGYAQDFLVLELLPTASPGRDYWPNSGRTLARMHSIDVPCFGFDADNYCGATPQINGRFENGYEFFARQRLEYQAQLALQRGLLRTEDAERIRRLGKKLPQLVPEQAPSLLHGDLWSGNIFCVADNLPALIDPATHWGWAEAELGMTQLFGGFPEAFYCAYQEIKPLENGWRERLPLYNLYHLLNHLNLFGRSYYAQAMVVLNRFL